MLPTSTLPVAPFLGPSGMGTLLGVLALGALAALLVGLMLHRRDTKASPAIALADADGQESAPAAKAPGARLSA